MNVDLKRETVDDILQLKEITGKTEDEIVITALQNFKKRVSMLSTTGITFFGLAIYISHLISNTNF